MTKDYRCFVCKYLGQSAQETASQLIYGKGSEQASFPLCYPHSVEYFKLGQVFFFEKYRKVFAGHVHSFEDEQILESANIYRFDPLKRGQE